MIIIGVVCLALANADKRGHNIESFNRAKIAWAVADGGGAKQFSNAFVTLGAPSLTFTVPGGSPFVVPMTLSAQATPLADTGGDAKGCVPQLRVSAAGSEPHARRSYLPVTFYTGSVPGGVWPTSLSSSNQQFTVTLSNTTVSTLIPAWTCANSQVSSGSGCGNNKNGGCTYTYFRTVSYLSTANMQVVLPDECSSGPCTPSQLTFSSCSLVYAPSPPVSSAWRRAATNARLAAADSRVHRLQSPRRSTTRTAMCVRAWAPPH